MSTVEDKIKFMTMLEDAIASAEESYGIKMDDAHVSGMVSYFNHVRPWETLLSPIVVGLSDEQINDIALKFLGVNSRVLCPTVGTYSKVIRDYLKSQTTSHYNNEEIARLERLNQTLHDELDEQLKPQQFQPNWDDAPDWADWLAQDSDGQWNWYTKKPIAGETYWEFDGECCEATNAEKNWIQTLQQRPKPTPQVEVGQVIHGLEHCQIS